MSTQTKSKTSRKRITFRLKAQPGSEVYIAGDFNNWDPSARRMKETDGNGNFSATMLLKPGEYQYKYIVNGQWSIDPECEEWIPNSMGSLNSVIRV
jgi:5'-AMP-activated protein kinase regulatory beta subunit